MTFSKARALRVLVAVVCTWLSLGCTGGGGRGNAGLNNGTFGLKITKLTGDKQFALPGRVFDQALSILVASDDGKPVSNATVKFTQTTTTNTAILTDTVTTDANGQASTHVRAATTYNTPIIITVSVDGTTLTAEFDISTSPVGAPSAIVVTTTNLLIERAGVGFSYIFSVVDDGGNVVNSYDNVDLDLNLTFLTDVSWSGKIANLPPATYRCHFTQGLCQTSPIYNLVDATKSTYLSVGAGALRPILNQEIQVLNSGVGGIVIADKAGGPATGALPVKAFENLTVLNADLPPITFFASLVDYGGNYVREAAAADGVTWTGETTVLNTVFPTLNTDLTPQSGGGQVVYGINKTIILPNTGRIHAQGPNLQDYVTGNIQVDPGAPAQLMVGTEHNQLEVAGVPANSTVSIADGKGNICQQTPTKAGISGTGTVSGTYQNATFGAQTTLMEPLFGTSLTNYYYNPPGTPINVVMFNGTVIGGPSVTIPRGQRTPASVAMKPQLNLTLTVPPIPSITGGFTLSGTSAPITVLPGPPTRLSVRRAVSGSPSAADPVVCDRLWQFWVGNNTPMNGCKEFNVNAGSPSYSYYSIVEDQGGNPLTYANGAWGMVDDNGTPAEQIITKFDATNAAFFDFNPKDNVSRTTFTPNTAGYGNLALRYTDASKGVNIATSYDTFTRVGGIDHFNLYYADGAHGSNNLVSATNPITMYIEARDVSDNLVVGFNGGVNMNFSITPNIVASPKGTPAYFPIMMVVNFSAGSASIGGLRIPNAMVNHLESVRASATISGSLSSSNLVTLQVDPGPDNRLAIRDQANGAGNDLTAAAFTVNADTSPNYFAIVYDSEGNVSTAAPVVNWTDTFSLTSTPTPVKRVTYNPTGSQTTFNLQNYCAGVNVGTMTTSYNGLTATTGQLTIVPGAYAKLSIYPTGSNVIPIAGQPLPFRVTMVDNLLNPVPFNGTKPFNFSVVNNTATRLGYTHTAPPNGSYTVTNGSISPDVQFTFYNNTITPKAEVDDPTPNPIITGQSQYLNVQNDAPSNFYVRRNTTNMAAGSTQLYRFYLQDQWGNRMLNPVTIAGTTTNYANANVTLSFMSALGGQDITGNSLGSASKDPTTKAVTGTLSSATASLNVTATQTGLLQMNAVVNGYTLTAANEREDVIVDPLPTVDHLVFSTAEPPTPTYTASKSTPMNEFQVEERDIYNNRITTDNSSNIVISVPSSSPGTPGQLTGTVTKPVVLGLATFSDLKYPRAHVISLNAKHPISGSQISASVTVSPNLPQQAVVILPGQTLVEGVNSPAAAVTGSPLSQLVDVAYNVNIYAVDEVYNRVPSYTGIASIGSVTGDPIVAITPPNINFSSALATFSVTDRKTGVLQIVPSTSLLFNTASSGFAVNPGTPTRLVTVMPGQVLNQGALSLSAAVTGTPTAQTAGTNFTTTVYATDKYYNVVNDSTTTVALALTDPNGSYDNGSTNLPMTNGSVSFVSTRFIKSQSGAIVTPSVASSSNSYTSLNASTPFIVSPAAATQAIAYLPAYQTYTTGQNSLAASVGGTIPTITAGQLVNVNVVVADAYYNPVPSYATPVGLNLSDANAALVGAVTPLSGIANFTGVQYITSTNGVANAKATPNATGLTNVASTNFVVAPNAVRQTIVTLPGQTYLPGKTSLAAAVINAPQTQTAGVAFNAIVYMVDQFFNQVIADSSTSVGINLDDTTTSPPANQTLAAGQATFSVTNTRAASQAMRATSAQTNLNSSTYVVLPNTVTQSFVRLPGQTLNSGYASYGSAVTGAPSAQTAGNAFSIDVLAVDNWFNQVTTYNGGGLSITMDDPNATNPAAAAFVGGIQSFSVTNYTASNLRSIAVTSALGTNRTSNTYVVNPNPVGTQLVTTLPGQVVSPGKQTYAAAVTGTIPPVDADVTFTATVSARDAYFNLINDSTTSVTLSSPTDMFASFVPTSGTLSSGTRSFNVKNHHARYNTLKAANVGSYTGTVSSQYWINWLSDFNVVALLPGQTLNEGASSLVPSAFALTTNAVTGTPSAQTAGVSMNVNVFVTDKFFNHTDRGGSYTALIATPNDPSTTLPAAFTLTNNAIDNGVNTTQYAPLKAGTQFVRPSLSSGSVPGTIYDSSNFTLGSAAATQTVLALANQTLVPGSTSLSVALPNTSYSINTDSTVTVTAYVVDQYFNPVTNLGGTAFTLSSLTDPNQTTYPGTFNSAGQATVTVEPVTPGNAHQYNITAMTGGLTQNPTETFAVTLGTPTFLVMQHPGETFTPARRTGLPALGGTPNAETAGTNYNLTVYLTDKKYNIINTGTPSTWSVLLTAPGDGYAVGMGSFNLAAGQATRTINNHVASNALSLVSTTANAPLTGINFSSSVYNVVAGTPTQTVVVLPGQVLTGGPSVLSTALTGTAAWTASSTARTAAVKLTDQFFNVVSSNASGVTLTDSLESSSTVPSTPTSFSAGSASFTVTTYRAGTHVFTPAYSSMTANTSSATVSPGAATQSIVYFPEQTYTSGVATFAAAVTGAVTPRNTDNTFSVNVRSVDQYFNTVPATSGGFTLTTSDPVDVDPTGTFSSGTATATVTPVRSGSWNASVVGFGTANQTTYTTTPGAATQLLPVLVGQTFVPGQTSLAAAVTGTPTARTSAVSFNVNVYLADQHFNAVTGTSGTIALTTPTDSSGVVATSPVAINTGTGRASFTVTNKTRGTAHQVQATSALVSGSFVSSNYTVNTGAPTQLVVILPGQSFTEGQPSASLAITGTPTTATAGTSFTAVVKAVDANFNQSSAYAGTVSLTSTDPNYVVSAAQSISNGNVASVNFTVTNKTATGGGAPASWTLSPAASGETPATTKVTSSSYATNPGAPFKILLGVGTSQGLNYVGTGGVGFAITGATTAATVNANYPVNLYSTDQWNNKTTDSSTQAAVASAFDTYASAPSVATMSGGSATLNFVHHRAGTNFTLSSTNTASLANTNSSAYTVNTAAATQLLAVLPGESLANPGAATRAAALGGAPTVQTAGTAFTTNVYLTDLYFNVVTGTTANVALTTLTDSAGTVATSPVAVNTATGIAAFSVTNNTRGASQNVRATTTLFGGTYDSTAYAVGAGAPTQLIVLLPGQSLVEGQSTAAAAITGSPTAQVAGAPFNVTVKAVDAKFNQSSGYAGTVSLTSTDPNFATSAAQSVSNGTVASLSFTVTNKTATGGAAPSAWTMTASSSGETPTTTKPASSAFSVGAGSASKILLAANGQSLGYVGTGGVGFAITGATSAATVNANYATTLYSTDQWNNRTADSSTQVSATSASDTFAPTPSNVTMTSGAVALNFVHHRAGSGFTLTSTNTASFTNTGSSTYTVNPAAASQLLTLLPGESLANAGASTRAAAIGGTPAAQSSGTAFTPTVYLTDLYYNVVTGTTANVALQSTTDSTATVATSPVAINTATGQASFSLTNRTRGSAQVARATTTLFAGNYDSTAYTVNAGAPTRLIVLLPGQSLVEGQSTASAAIVGAPSAAVAGASFAVTVKAVDANFNQSSAYAGLVSLTGTDPNFAVGAAQSISNGTVASVTFNVTDKTVTGGSAPAGWTLSPAASGETPTTTKLASSAYSVTPGSANRILIGAGGQTLGYVGTGGVGFAITGAAGTATVNAAYASNLYSTDQWNNLTNDSTTQASVTSASDAFATPPSNATMTAGSASVNFVHHRAGTGFTFNSTNTNSLTNTTSSTFTVVPAAASTMLVLMPGQTLANPGASSRAAAVGGSVGAITAGTAFAVNAYVTDLYYNVITNNSALNSRNVQLAFTGDSGTAPAAAAPVNCGAAGGCLATFSSVTNVTAGSGHAITASLAAGSPSVANDTSTSYTVTSAGPAHLFVVLPGETYVTGQTTVSGTATTQTAGTAFGVTIKLTDAYYNDVTYSGSPTVNFTTTAANSPGGSAPTLGTFSGSFSNGVASIPGFNLYKAVNTGKIAAAIPSLSLSSVQSNQVPVTFAGLNTLTVRDTAGGAGSAVTTATYSTSGTSPVFYAAGYDAYGNYRGDASATWTATRASSGDLNSSLSASPATSTTLNLATAGAGTLTLAADGGGGITAATGTLTILDQGAASFTVTTSGTPTAGGSFNVIVTAKAADGTTTATSYAGTKTISFATTASTSVVNACTGSTQTVTLPTSVSFTSGQATIPLTLFKGETGRTVTVGATNITSGTSANFDVGAGALACLSLRTAAGGAGSVIASTLSWNIDDSQVFYAAGYDSAGNYLADQSATWSGSGELTGLPYPSSANIWSRVVGVKSGSGGVLTANASGVTKTVTINVGTGSRLITSATVDSSTTRHLLQADAVVDVKAWSPGTDAVSSWIGDGSRSWYTQAASPDADRGVRYDFPARVHVVANQSAVSIIDATTNDLFLRFDAGANYALDSNLGAVTKVEALNGKLFIGMSGGLTIVDFTNDAIFKVTGGSAQKTTGLGTTRNSAHTWSADATYPALAGNAVAALSANRIGGQDYLAIGTDNGLEVLKTSGTSSSCAITTSANVPAVRLTSGGAVYFANSGVSAVSPNLSSLSGSCGALTATYGLGTNARVPTQVISAIDVAEGLSAASSGANVIEVATGRGLTVIQENSPTSASISRTYVTTAGSLYAGHARLNQAAITAPDNGQLTTAGTFEFYVRPDVTYDSSLTTNKVLAQKGDGTRTTEGNFGIELVAGSGVVEFYVVINGTSYVVDSASSLTAGSWYYVSAQVSAAGVMDLWVNGVNATNSTGQNVNALSNGTLYLGGGTAPASSGITGALDDVRVSTVARYASGTSLATPGAAFAADGATAYLYHFDDQQGTSATDQSGNGTLASLGSGAVFASPMLAGGSNNVVALRGVSLNGHATALAVTGASGQVNEVRSLEAPASVTLGSTAAAGATNAVDVFQIISEISYDWLIGATGGLTLNRR